MRHGAKNVSPALLPPTFTFFECNLAKFTFKRQPRSCPAEAPARPASTLQRSTRALDAEWYMLSVRSESEADPDKYTSRTETHAANHIPPLSGLPRCENYSTIDTIIPSLRRQTRSHHTVAPRTRRRPLGIPAPHTPPERFETPPRRNRRAAHPSSPPRRRIRE